MAKRFQQDSGEERVTAISKPMMNLIARTPSFVSSSTSLSPGKRYCGKQDPWKFVVADDRSGQPDELSSSDYSNWIITVLGLLKSGKVRLRRTIDQGNLIKLLGDMVQQVRPYHGDALLDGNAQSLRYGGILRDRSGQPDNINSQEVAYSTNFIMGNDAAEFMNKEKDQVRKRQKRMSIVAGTGEEHSNYLENVSGCDDECSDIHGKEFPGQSKFHYEYNRSHPEEKCSTYLQNWWANKMRSPMWNKIHWENTHGNICQ